MLNALKCLLGIIVFFTINTLMADTRVQNAIAPIPLPEGVSIHMLDNGLQILLIENKGLPMTGVNVVVKTGSAYETFSTSGMSHMLEHLLFNGTVSRTQKQLYDDVDLIGGYNNANTGHYYTNYMMVTPADQIKKGLEIQADMLFNSILPEEKFDKEKGIVLEEIARSLENTEEQLSRNVNAILFDGHALSLPTLGTYATIKSLNRDDVYAYYKNTYVPNNMIMSVVGNFSKDSILVWINNSFGKNVPGDVQFSDNKSWKAGFDEVPVIQNISGKSYNRYYRGEKLILEIYYELPLFWQDAHFNLIDEALSQAKQGIIKSLKHKYPVIESSLTTDHIHTPVANYLKISVTGENKNELPVIGEDVNKRFKEVIFSLNQETVNYLATAQKTSFLKNIEKPHMFGIYNAHLFAEGGIEAVLQSYEKSVYTKAARDIENFKLNKNPVIVMHSPFGSGGDRIIESALKPEGYVDKKSGLHVIAEQNPNSNLLAVHFLIKHKAQYENIFGKDAAQILHDCLGQRFSSLENQAISNEFGLSYTVNDNPFIPMDNIYLDPDFSYIRVEGLAENIPGIIRYLEGQIIDFTPQKEEYEKAIANTKRPMMGMGSSQSSQLFERTYRSLIYEEEKFPPLEEQITYDKLLQFSSVYFQPSNLIVSVVSPETPANIFSLFQWEQNNSVSSYDIDQRPYIQALKVPSESINQNLDGGGERSFLFWGFIKKIEEQDKPALQALGLLLTDYIVFDIREKQGRAYRMNAGIDLVLDKALFYINLGTRPANIDSLIEQAPGFFSQQVVNTFSDFDLKKSINMYLGRMMFRRLSSINKGFYLGHSEYFHQNLNYDTDFLIKLKNITLTDIQEISKRYLNMDNPVMVIVR